MMKAGFSKRKSSPSKQLALLGTTAMFCLIPNLAQAKGTQAHTVIENTFQFEYSIAGAQQETLTNNTDPLSFAVDRYARVTVTSMGDVTVLPNALGQELVFSVRNDGNDTQLYDLSVINNADDDFDPSTLSMHYIVDDGDGVYEGEDEGGRFTEYDENNKPREAAIDGIIWVAVRGDMPVINIQGQEAVASIDLVASVINPEAITQDKTTASFKSGDFSSFGKTAHETSDADTGSFRMTMIDISASTSVSLHDDTDAACDDFLLVMNDGLAIPGACVEYGYAITNNDGVMSVDGGVFETVLNENLTFMGFDATGFSGGNIVQPRQYTDCAMTACTVRFTEAMIPASTTAQIRVRARLK